MEKDITRNELTPEECKKRLLEVLNAFDTFCKKNDISYYMMWGTLLGTVRHKGFIPWDDDIDVGVPRKDYERLIEISKEQNEEFDFLCYEKDEDYPIYFGKFSDKATEIENKYVRSIKGLGLYVDVFPIDEISINPEEGGKITKKLLRLEYLQNLSSMKKFWPASGFFKSIAKYVLYVYGKIRGHKCWEKKRRKYIASLTDGRKGSCKDYYLCANWIVKRQWFNSSVELPFEGYSFSCPEGYEEFLTARYGDYMKLPPLETRVSQHDYKAFWK